MAPRIIYDIKVQDMIKDALFARSLEEATHIAQVASDYMMERGGLIQSGRRPARSGAPGMTRWAESLVQTMLQLHADTDMAQDAGRRRANPVSRAYLLFHHTRVSYAPRWLRGCYQMLLDFLRLNLGVFEGLEQLYFNVKPLSRHNYVVGSFLYLGRGQVALTVDMRNVENKNWDGHRYALTTAVVQKSMPSEPPDVVGWCKQKRAHVAMPTFYNSDLDVTFDDENTP